VIYANHSLSNDLSFDGQKIVEVLDNKSIMNDISKPNSDHLSNVRIIEFTKDMVKVSFDLRKKPEIELKLTKSNQNLFEFNQLYQNLKPAYEDYIPIRKEKYEDVKKLLNYILLLEGSTFYSDSYLKIKTNSNKKLFESLFV
jgi:hypothetical protein